MIHRMLRYPAGWEWHVLQQARQLSESQESLPSRKTSSNQSVAANPPAVLKDHQAELEQANQQINEIKRLFPECASWIDDCEGRLTNQIAVNEAQGIGPIIYGTLMAQISEHTDDIQPVHFWVSKHRIITMHSDIRLPLRLQSTMHIQKYEECKTAPEAFCTMLSFIAEVFHSGIDEFEDNLRKLEKIMRHRNHSDLIDVIIENRFELLHWSHLFIPVNELYGAAKEAFINELTDTEAFVRITHKLERVNTLLTHYSAEIDTLISMDDAISNFRGNDIMKTLTIFTVLFLPASVAGAIWGSNFISLPWKDHPWGFAAMLTIVIALTIGIYIGLWKKGWTGDLVNRQRDDADATEPQAMPRRSRSNRSSSKSNRKKSNAMHSSASSSAAGQSFQSRSRKKRM